MIHRIIMDKEVKRLFQAGEMIPLVTFPDGYEVTILRTFEDANCLVLVVDAKEGSGKGAVKYFPGVHGPEIVEHKPNWIQTSEWHDPKSFD